MTRIVNYISIASITFLVGVTIAVIYAFTNSQPAINTDNPSSSLIAVPPTVTPIVERIPDSGATSIRQIDFPNFTYQGSKGLFPTAEYETQTYTLRNGESPETEYQYGMRLVNVSYGDVTGDESEEAMINLYVLTDGSAGVHHVYIYTFQNNQPRFLCGFESGDRASGGLKSVYAEGGKLVVELYGRGTQIEGDLGMTEPVGYCCPRSFTRTKYQWRGSRFRQQGEMEILPLPNRYGTSSQ